MAARVAAELSKAPGVNAVIVRGGLGEFSVNLDGRQILDTNRFWYPTPGKVIAKVRAELLAQPSDPPSIRTP
jgi:hypothetical protein